MYKFKKKKFPYKTIVISCLLFLALLITLNGCIFIPKGSIYVTSEPSGAKIYLNGEDTNKETPAMISNIFSGSYSIKVNLEEKAITREELVEVFQKQVTSVHFELLPVVTYRALCVGVNDYKDPGITDLRAPSYDVERITEVFENSRFGDEEHTFNSIDVLLGSQATRNNILQAITSSFSEADQNDVLYFYFSGHGWGGNGNISTILPYDADAGDEYNDISADDLASALSMIPGTKVVILDSCFSGGFIGKDAYVATRRMEINDTKQYNDNIINSFEKYDLQLSKDNLAKNSFKVITSASSNQLCYETLYHPVDGNPFGYFSASICDGCGYNDFFPPFPADFNTDSKITINEIYEHVVELLRGINQDAQVYPANSSFSFIEY